VVPNFDARRGAAQEKDGRDQGNVSRQRRLWGNAASVILGATVFFNHSLHTAKEHPIQALEKLRSGSHKG